MKTICVYLENIKDYKVKTKLIEDFEKFDWEVHLELKNGPINLIPYSKVKRIKCVYQSDEEPTFPEIPECCRVEHIQ